MTNSHCCSILQLNAIVELMLFTSLIGNAILFVLFLYYKIVRNILEYDGVIMITIVVIAIKTIKFFLGVWCCCYDCCCHKIARNINFDVAIQYNMR